MRRRVPLAAALLSLTAVAATAQVAPNSPPAVAGPRVNVSGLMLGNFQYHLEPGADSAADEQRRAGANQNQFVIERLYLTVRSTITPKASVRATAELYNGASGYQLRVKYGYLDYRFVDREATTAFVRVGLLQNIMIDQEETYWPRYVGTSPLARYFSASDLGVSVGATLPGGLGDVYAEVVDGRGYQGVGSADDRFKDFAARVTLTPFATAPGTRALRPLVIVPWYYKGDTASIFGPNSSRSGADGYLGPLRAGRQRDRYGLFAAWDDPRLRLGVSLARRRSEIDAGENTALSPPTTTVRTGSLFGTFAIIRPLAFADSAGQSPFSVVLRYDRDDPNTAASGHVRFLMAGLTYDVTPDVSVALDYEEMMPQAGQPATAANLRKVYLARFQARF